MSRSDYKPLADDYDFVVLKSILTASVIETHLAGLLSE